MAIIIEGTIPEQTRNRLAREIQRQIVNKFEAIIPSIVKNVRTRLQDFIREKVKGEPEYTSLLNGTLRGELGIPNNRIDEVDLVIEAIVEGMDITTIPFRTFLGKAVGGLRVSILRKDQSEVFDRVSGEFTSKRGYLIEWLRWLLTAGNSLIIVEYVFEPGNTKGSRTGLGIMVRQRGGVWRVPPEFSGTLENNWLTRALLGTENQIQELILQELFRAF